MSIRRINLKDLLLDFDKPQSTEEAISRINQKLDIIELKINEIIDTVNPMEYEGFRNVISASDSFRNGNGSGNGGGRVHA